MNADVNLILVTATINGLIFQNNRFINGNYGGGGGCYACPGETVSQNACYRFVTRSILPHDRTNDQIYHVCSLIADDERRTT